MRIPDGIHSLTMFWPVSYRLFKPLKGLPNLKHVAGLSMKQNQLDLNGMSPAAWLELCRQTIKKAKARGQNVTPFLRLQAQAFEHFESRFNKGL